MRLVLDLDLLWNSTPSRLYRWLGGISSCGGTRTRLKLETTFFTPKDCSLLRSHSRRIQSRLGKFLDSYRAKLTTRSRLHWFNTLGIFIGRALLDSRIIDLNLNKVLLQLILGIPIKKNIATMRLIDEQLARSLERLQAYLNARKDIEALPLVCPFIFSRVNRVMLIIRVPRLRSINWLH
jgi:hypothetical protein